MKIAIFPGSFNPYHIGHRQIAERGLQIFDKVILAIGNNPEKTQEVELVLENIKKQEWYGIKNGCIEVVSFDGLFSDYVNSRPEIDAVIKGIRNIQDFEYEKSMLYWNQDLGIKRPTYFVIADRDKCHISSSAIRAVEKFG